MGQAPRPLTPHLSVQHLFGAELRHWRESRGLSQDELGSRINFSGDHIAKIEKAERFPSAALAERCDEALSTGGVLRRMWPAAEYARQAHADNAAAHADCNRIDVPRRPTSSIPLPDTYWYDVVADSSTPSSWREGGDDDVRRRQLLMFGGTTLSAHLLDLLDREPDQMRAALDLNCVSEDRLRYVEGIADALGERVVQLPPLQLLEPTLSHFRSVRSMLRERQSTPHQIRLVRAAGKLATIVGEILFNQGAFRDARQWYLAAMHAALDVGDRYLADIALAGLSYLPTYAGDPQAVLRLTSERLDQISDHTPAISWLWGMSARAHASLGDRSQFKRAITRAREVLDLVPQEGLRPGIFSFLPEKLAFYEANGYAKLGDPSMTADAASRALQLYDPRETTEPALVKLDYATALAQSGELDEACEVATRALTAENTFIGVTVAGRAKEFDEALGGSRLPAVIEWRDHLRSEVAGPAIGGIEPKMDSP